MKKFIYIFVIIISYKFLLSQNPEWVVYNTSNSGLYDNIVISLSIDSFNNKWIGGIWSHVNKFDDEAWFDFEFYQSARDIYDIKVDKMNSVWISYSEGLAKYDGSELNYYTNENSGLPYNRIFEIEVDNKNNLWLGLGGNIVIKYDRENWYQFFNNTTNWQDVKAIKFDDSNNVWVGYYTDWSDDEGLGVVSKFDGTNWVNFIPGSSGLPLSYGILDLNIDKNNVKWIGTIEGGLVRFDDSTWTVWNIQTNSGIPDNSVEAIAIDDSNVKWIGTRNGFAKYDDTSWTVWTTENSDLPSNDIRCIVIDKYDNKWIGTNNGLAVFREGGVVGVEDISNNDVNVLRFYPNPVEDKLTIISDNLVDNIFIYDFLGREQNCEFKASEFETSVNTSGLSNGLYLLKIVTQGKIVMRKFVIQR